MNKMILLDIETQSFSVESGIYEVACLAIENYEIVDQLYLGKEIEGYQGERKFGFGFINISQDQQSINTFKEFLNRYPYPIVAHNCPFDKKFLTYYRWIADDYPTFCSMRAIRKEVSLESYALNYLVQYYGVASNIEHDAMSDVINLYKILKRIKPKTWHPTGTVYRNNWKWFKIKPRALEDIDLKINTTDILACENVCFTGKSKFPRHIMQEIAIKNGAEISNNITSKTTLLVVGLDPGKINPINHLGGITGCIG